MTRVTIKTDGISHSLKAVGHATGSTEVCAAISGILYALAGYIANAADGGAAAPYELRMAGGDVLIAAGGDEGVTAAFDMAAVGLLQLEAKYPELISVEIIPVEKSH